MPPTHPAPSAPFPKNRSLFFAEREEIALECARGTGVRAHARKLRRSPGTISREIRRNSVTRGGDFAYRGINAQWQMDRSATRPNACKLALDPALRDQVRDRLSGLIATPDGIAFTGPVVVWKKPGHAHQPRSHLPSSLYLGTYIQERSALKRKPSTCLRSGRAFRLPRERARNRGYPCTEHATTKDARLANAGRGTRLNPPCES